MTDQDLTELTLADAAAHIQGGGLSPVELTETMLARIDRLNPELVAYVTVSREEALADARAAEAEIRDGKYGGRCTGFPCPSRTTSRRGAFAPPRDPRCWRTAFRTTMPRWWRGSGRRGR